MQPDFVLGRYPDHYNSYFKVSTEHNGIVPMNNPVCNQRDWNHSQTVVLYIVQSSRNMPGMSGRVLLMSDKGLRPCRTFCPAWFNIRQGLALVLVTHFSKYIIILKIWDIGYWKGFTISIQTEQKDTEIHINIGRKSGEPILKVLLCQLSHEK